MIDAQNTRKEIERRGRGERKGERKKKGTLGEPSSPPSTSTTHHQNFSHETKKKVRGKGSKEESRQEELLIKIKTLRVKKGMVFMDFNDRFVNLSKKDEVF